jgi:hypothetical protein
MPQKASAIRALNKRARGPRLAVDSGVLLKRLINGWEIYYMYTDAWSAAVLASFSRM